MDARKRAYGGNPGATDCGLWTPATSAVTRVFNALCAGVSGSRGRLYVVRAFRTVGLAI
jgi:hypothetical protein